MKTKKRINSKKIIKVMVVCSVLLVISSVFSTASLAKVNFEVEQLKVNIKKQDNKNESIQMKINELSSLENIKVVVEDMGLAFNNDNIVTAR